MGWKRLGFRCRSARQVECPPPSSLDQGQTFRMPDPYAAPCLALPRSAQLYLDVIVVAILLGEALLGGCLPCRLWDRLRHSDCTGGWPDRRQSERLRQVQHSLRRELPLHSAAPRIGKLLQSPFIFHREAENARSHGAMVSTMTRREASPRYRLRNQISAEPTTLPVRYSAVPPSPLRAPRCRVPNWQGGPRARLPLRDPTCAAQKSAAPPPG